MKPSKYIAEFIATFSLALAVSLSLQSGFLLMTPIVAALTLGLFVYTVGAISGAHVNPAITVALLVVGKIKGLQALGYIIAQLLAGLIVFLLLNNTGNMPAITSTNVFEAGLAETIGAFFLGFGVAAAVWGKVTQSASGLVVGSSLLLGIVIAVALGSNGVLNPAVALGLGTFDIAYIFGPLVGATFAMVLYSWIAKK